MQRGGETGSGSILLFCVIGLVVAGLIAVQIYFNVRFYKNIHSLQHSTSEIKSKIGSLVRDINFMHQQDYKVDVEQQENINKLSMMMGM